MNGQKKNPQRPKQNPPRQNQMGGPRRGRGARRGNRGRPIVCRRIPLRTTTITVRRKEKWFDVNTGITKYTMLPGESGIPILDQHASIYENYAIDAFKILYKSASGTTVPGTITLGIDYAPGNENRKTSSDVSMLDLSATGAISKDSSIIIPRSTIMKGNTMLYTKASKQQGNRDHPFALYVDAKTESKDIGNVWVQYTIRFFNATAPTSGGLVGEKIDIATSSANFITDIQVTPANVSEVSGTSSESVIKIDTPTEPSEISENSTDYKSVYEISEKADVGSKLTFGTSQPIDPSLMYATMPPPKIQFKYKDGTPVPAGTIVPLNSGKLHTPGVQHSIFATLFAIAKPLLKPVLATLLQTISSSLKESPEGVLYADGEEVPIQEVAADQVTTFAFQGEEATINVPYPIKNTLAASFPINIVLGLGHGAQPKVKDFAKVYSHTIATPNDAWIKKVEFKSGKSAYDEYMEITVSNPADYASSWQAGDLVSFFFTVVPMDTGIQASSSIYFTAKFKDDVIADIKKRMQGSQIYSGSEPTTEDPYLKIIQVKDTTRIDDQKAKIGKHFGLHILGRFMKQGPLGDNPDYTTARLHLPAGNLAVTINIDTGNFIPPANLDDIPFEKPDKDYAVGVAFMSVTLFPTGLDTIDVPAQSELFTITAANLEQSPFQTLY